MRTDRILRARGRSSKPTTYAYGAHVRQSLDVWGAGASMPVGAGMPVGPTTPNGAPRPAVVFFYGGSWTRGAKDSYGMVGQRLAAKGHVCIIPDYRLYPEVIFPSFVEDAAAAVAWVIENHNKIGVDIKRIFLMGHSAGGHLAMSVSVDPLYLAKHGLKPSAIAGAVGLAASCASPLEGEFERIFPRPSARPFRPIEIIGAIDVPLLLIHGRRDKTISPIEATSMADAYTKAGGTASVRFHPIFGHATILASIATTRRFGAGADLMRFLHGPGLAR